MNCVALTTGNSDRADLLDEQQRIDRLVRQLQWQTDVPLWVFAHSEAIKAVAFDQPLVFGPRGRVVHRIFGIAGNGVAALLVFWAIGLAVVVRRWFGVALSKKMSADGVLVGMGAGSEEPLFERFKAETVGFALCVRHDAPRTFGNVCKPTLGSLLEQLWAECKKVYAGLRQSGEAAIAGRFSMWMTVSAMRVGTYTFIKVWAAQLPPEVKRVVFIAADVQCFAAVDGRHRDQCYMVEYWQHGLHSRWFLIPPVDRIVALNNIEGRQMHCLSGRPFHVIGARRAPSRSQHTATLLFASIYTGAGFDKKNHIVLLQQLIDWAAHNALSIVIRPHPREDQSFWVEHFPALKLDRVARSFADCVGQWRPSLVVSWFSTALLDALRLGVAPVLLTEGSAPFLRDMVLPLDRVAFRWPEETELIENITRDQTEYQRWVSRRWEEVFAPNSVEGVSDECNHIAFHGPTR